MLPGLGKLSISFTEAAPERKSLTCNHQAHLFADVGFERDAMLKFTDLNCYHQNFPWSDTSRLSSKPAGDPERVPAMNPQGVVFDKQIKVEISVGHQHCPDNMDAGFVPSTAALMTPEFCKEYFRQIMDDCESTLPESFVSGVQRGRRICANLDTAQQANLSRMFTQSSSSFLEL